MTTPDLAAAEDFHWALIGPGRIAGRFAEAVGRLPGMRLSHVLGRDAQRARDFAARWPDAQGRLPQAGSDLAAALADPSIHGVYVATPHAQHGEAVQAALAAGKAVLCEKPLVPNRAQGEALVALARQRGAFLMEAVWTRFLPVYETVGQWLREGAIGELRAVQSSFCFPATYDPAGRLFNPALAGGALLDIGIYNLSVSRWVLQQALGHCPEYEQLQVSGLLAPTGVDKRLNVGLQLPGGLSVQFLCALDACADNALRIYGSAGYIELPQRFWQATEARLRRRDEPEQRVQRPLAINGFEGEILEAVRCVRAGLLESPQISHAESLATLAWMDAIRARLGLRYPFEA